MDTGTAHAPHPPPTREAVAMDTGDTGAAVEGQPNSGNVVDACGTAPPPPPPPEKESASTKNFAQMWADFYTHEAEYVKERGGTFADEWVAFFQAQAKAAQQGIYTDHMRDAYAVAVDFSAQWAKYYATYGKWDGGASFDPTQPPPTQPPPGWKPPAKAKAKRRLTRTQDGMTLVALGLPPDVTKADVIQYFGKFGDLLIADRSEAVIVEDGLALLTYEDDEAAEEALKQCADASFNGTKIHVRLADKGMHPDDWKCGRCSAKNFATVPACNRCRERRGPRCKRIPVVGGGYAGQVARVRGDGAGGYSAGGAGRGRDRDRDSDRGGDRSGAGLAAEIMKRRRFQSDTSAAAEEEQRRRYMDQHRHQQRSMGGFAGAASVAPRGRGRAAAMGLPPNQQGYGRGGGGGYGRGRGGDPYRRY